MLTDKLNYQIIKDVMIRKKYKFFNESYDLNNIGIRTNDKSVNAFNDFLGSLFVDDKQHEIIKILLYRKNR
jgi:hypothetical protein